MTLISDENSEKLPVIRVYATKTCGFCHAAKALLETEGWHYESIDLTNRPDERQALIRTTGKRTVPQIFVGEVHIGGYTELRAARDSGRLNALMHRRCT
tara:strand:+ start:197 stop:493 length:297 start_codon:yes stop_codon:yes gene_type:complete